MFFHWSLCDSKSHQVFRTLLSILAVLNNAGVRMVSTRLPTSKSSSPFNNPLVTVPKAPITIGIIVSFMFHNCFNSLARSKYLSFFSYSFSFILWSAGTAKLTILQILFFFFCWLLLGLVFWPRWGDPSVCQSPIGVYVCHFLGQMLGCAYTICSYGQIEISCTSPSGIIIIIIIICEFFSTALVDFHWSLSNSKSPQVPWTLLIILADFNNFVVWMVSVLPLISNS